MDYQNLYEMLPKKSKQWSTNQTSKWLQFINLPHLILSFRQAGIDGSCIHCLDEQTLKNQLNIKSAIVRKKLINWISVGLDAFDRQISANAGVKGLMIPAIPLKKSVATCVRNESKTKLSTHNEVSSFGQMNNEENISTYMILEQIEGNGIGCNIVKNEILSIGFGRFNNITSLETSISQKHALVGYKNGGFFVQDLGSKFGTFIKISHRALLRYGMILEIGSYQFMVVTIQKNTKNLRLKQVYYCPDDEQSQNNKSQVNIVQGARGGMNGTRNINKKNMSANLNSLKTQHRNQELVLNIDLKEKQKYTFGRRKQNDFQKDDKHMSGMHCKITYFNDNFYIEDYGSTNGTWIRISPEHTISPEVTIQTDCIIKLGAAISYSCKINTENKNKKKLNNNGKKDNDDMVDENLCKVCKIAENNCLFLPCSHNICCMECCGELGNTCPECYHQIAQKIKIHK